MNKIPQKTCLLLSDLFVVATGMNLVAANQFAIHKSEVINLSNENVSCSNISDFPEPIFKASGGLVGSTPIICGGEKQMPGRGNNEATGFCYKLNKGK